MRSRLVLPARDLLAGRTGRCRDARWPAVPAGRGRIGRLRSRRGCSTPVGQGDAMTQEQQPAVMVDDGSGNPVDRKNLRTAAWGGLIGTALEQYDFVIDGTATAIVFARNCFRNAGPGVGLLAGF